MRKMRVLLALTVIFLVMPTAAEHMYVDTDTLYGWCRPYEVGDIGPDPLCAGYITAVIDIMADGGSIHDYRACVPDTVELSDLRDLVINELDKRPKKGHANAHIWTAGVFAHAYPCIPANGQ
jgi:hypothetical protein